MVHFKMETDREMFPESVWVGIVQSDLAVRRRSSVGMCADHYICHGFCVAFLTFYRAA